MYQVSTIQAESNVHVGIEDVYSNPQQTWEEVTEGANSMYNKSCLIFAWTYNKKYSQILNVNNENIVYFSWYP